MVSVEQWKSHFKKLAHKAYPSEDMYIVNQTGRGLGRNSYKKTLYRVRSAKEPSGPNPTVQIVSPVAQAVEQARALVKSQPIKRPSSSAGGSSPSKKSKKGGGTGKSQKKKTNNNNKKKKKATKPKKDKKKKKKKVKK